MTTVSSDPISAAMIETEKEVAGFAWDQEDTEAADATGDRSLEDLGNGLEGQHELEADEVSDEEVEDDAAAIEAQEAEAAQAVADKTTGKVEQTKPAAPEVHEGRVPSAKLREANDAKRAAETERDTLKAALEKSNAESQARIDLVMKEIAALKTAPRTEAPRVEPKVEAVPDIFEDPKGFAEHLTKGFQTELAKRDTQLNNQRVETSMAIAHAFHKDTFEKAWENVNKLNPQDPDVRATVQRIYASPNPGEALVAWHKRNETLAMVGDDPTKFVEKTKAELRESLMKDPEFRKQLLADIRGEAANGNNGQANTTTRLPRSLARAAGSNLGTDRIDPNATDDSPQAIADSAWR